MYFRFLDADSIENFEVSSKFHREQLVMCSAWKLMVKRDFPWIYKDVRFEEKYQEHLFYKKKYRMYKFVIRIVITCAIFVWYILVVPILYFVTYIAGLTILQNKL